MEFGDIAAIVGGILLVLALVWLPLSMGAERCSRAVSQQLEAICKAGGETMLMGPVHCQYRGAAFKYDKVKGSGMICVTEKRVLFERLSGSRVDIPRSEIAQVTEDRLFRGRRAFAMGDKRHLVIHTKDGNEIGFLMKDVGLWRDQLNSGTV